MDYEYLEPIEAGESVHLNITINNVYDNLQQLQPSGYVKIYIGDENVTMRCLDKISQNLTPYEVVAKIDVKTNSDDGGKRCTVVYEFKINNIPHTRSYVFFISERKKVTVSTERLNELERIEKASKELIKNVHPYVNESGVIKHSLHDWGRFIRKVEDI